MSRLLHSVLGAGKPKLIGILSVTFQPFFRSVTSKELLSITCRSLSPAPPSVGHRRHSLGLS